MVKRIRAISVAALVTVLVLLTAISVVAQSHIPLEDPIPEIIEQGPLQIALEPLSSGMTAPNYGTFAPACRMLENKLFVTDQVGILWGVNLISGEKNVVLDVSDRLVALGVGGPGTFDERGFLGVAFHPNFAENGHLYTYTSEPVSGAADFSTMPEGVPANHQSVVLEWQIPDPCSPDSVVDPTSARELLRIDEPQFNHDAGTLAFGPDGMLYISLGDGGAADDQGVGHVEGGNGQEPGNILGTVIRIDPDGSNSANGQYGIPQDNPFAGVEGFVDEIFAYGFRNPFRFSFDSRTGEMYIADVGQNDIEEIDIGVPGGNYGWRIKEGSFCFDPNGTGRGFVFACQPGDAPAGLIDPIAEYDHDEGIAIVGGFVYRGSQIPPLRGRYVFGDYIDPSIGSGRLFYLQKNQRILEFKLAGLENVGFSVLGFGQDANGELYLLASQTGVPFGETGVVLRIAPSHPGQQVFTARLSGAAEVPPVETQAHGQAIFRFQRDFSEMNYKLVVDNLQNAFAAHIHCAQAGVNGPVGVTLFSGGPTSMNGVLVQAAVTSPNEGNACGWTTLEDVVNAIQNDNAYVNVHTTANPGGEIRGQIR